MRDHDSPPWLQRRRFEALPKAPQALSPFRDIQGLRQSAAVALPFAQPLASSPFVALDAIGRTSPLPPGHGGAEGGGCTLDPWPKDAMGLSGQRQDSFVFNVQDFGAKGDLSDDTGAIWQALGAAERVAGCVYFPPGAYLVSWPLSIGTGVTLAGPGAPTIGKIDGLPGQWEFHGGATLIFAPPAHSRQSGFLLIASDSVATISGLAICHSSNFNGRGLIYLDRPMAPAIMDRSDIHFTDCAFFGPASIFDGSVAPPAGAASLVNMNWPARVTIENCRFANSRIGIRGDPSVSTSPSRFLGNVGIMNCSFENHSESALFHAGEPWLVSGCLFSSSGVRSAQPIVSAYDQDPTYPSAPLSFLGCWFGNMTGSGGTWIHVKSSALYIAGCCFHKPGPFPQTSIRLMSGSTAATITGNWFQASSNAIYFEDRVSGVSILGNDFTDTHFPLGIPGNADQLVAIANVNLANSGV